LPSVIPSNNPTKKHRYYADNFKEGNSQEEVKTVEIASRKIEARKASTPFSRQ